MLGKRIRWQFVSLLLLLAVSSCEKVPRSAQSSTKLVYDYALEVEDTQRSGDPHTSFTVLTGEAKSRRYHDRKYAFLTEHAYLFVYSTIYRVESEKEVLLPRYRFVPQDTLLIALSRSQIDTIYQLVRRVFQLQVQPEQRDILHPPTYLSGSVHDVDRYLTVRFIPHPYGSLTFECIGYQEYNDASYRLRAYLQTIRTRFEKRQIP